MILRAKIKIMKKLLLRSLTIAGLISAFTLLSSQQASAATVTLNGGCSIDNAILSANNDADTGGCTGSGIYGDDEIIVPTGTWNVGASVQSEGNLTVTGAGMGDSIIDAGDNYAGIQCNNTGVGLLNLDVNGLTIRNTVSSSGAFPLAAGNCNLSVSDVEITDSQEDANIYFNLEQDGVTAQLNISNVYIHDTLGAGVTVLVAGEGVTNQADVQIDNLTVAQANNNSKVLGGVAISAGDDNIASNHTANVLIRNSTFTDNGTNDSYGVFGVAQSGIGGGVDTVDIALDNITIVNHKVDGSFPASGILAAASTPTGGTANVSITATNVLLANNTANSAQANCAALGFGSGGTETAIITSLGNNITDDTSCGFTSSGDQQNVTNILSTLGPLQDNGGSVPTMALLTGSPAIDGGAVVSGITADQRGVARPQCAAFDVGAYEYDGVCPTLVSAPSNPSESDSMQNTLAETGDNYLSYFAGFILLIATGFGILRRIV
ncbi:MAG: hypothetical protein QG658_31 [Patescibacteria group bacterium]|nr:hypothetical protein [Patescibacteria group bacterium]